MHIDAGQQVQHVGAFGYRHPVVLHVGARGEVAVAVTQRRAQHFAIGQRNVAQLVLRGAGLLQQGGIGLVKLARNAGQHTQLCAGDFAIRHRHAQHRRVALDVPAVLQAQRFELVFAQFASLPALQLVTVLGSTQLHELFVKVGVLVHL